MKDDNYFMLAIAIKRIHELEKAGQCSVRLWTKERAAHLATLERVEWCIRVRLHNGRADYQCPECYQYKDHGKHADDCEIDAEIKRLEGE